MSCLKLLHILTEVFCGVFNLLFRVVWCYRVTGAWVVLVGQAPWLHSWSECWFDHDVLPVFYVTTFYGLNLPGIFVSLLKRDLDLWELYFNINFVMFSYEVSVEVSDFYHFAGVYTISSVYIYLYVYIHIYIHTHLYM